MGDASAEEDYVLGALGWASTKNLPILFVVEDNNLSILTEKQTRRNWDIHNVSNAFGISSYNISDNPIEILQYKDKLFKEPIGMPAPVPTILIFLIDTNVRCKLWGPKPKKYTKRLKKRWKKYGRNS